MISNPLSTISLPRALTLSWSASFGVKLPGRNRREKPCMWMVAVQ